MKTRRVICPELSENERSMDLTFAHRTRNNSLRPEAMIEQPHYRTTLDSPYGTLTLLATDSGLRAVLWEDDDPSRVPRPERLQELTSHPVLRTAISQLKEYFAGARIEFDLPLDLRGTEFQQLAWRSLATIPYGTTVSYGEQAERVGRPKAVRAVGAANGKNPISIVLPCHRVVGADGSLRGFAGGINVKRRLLRFEKLRT